MKRYKKNPTVYLLITLLLGITLGYAYLNTELNINGTTNITSANWSIYWDNIVFGSNNVTDVTTPATISQGLTEVTFNVNFKEPGDTYEFTVDAVNDGSIDAMISTFSKGVYAANGTTPKTLPDYLEYTVTDSDGDEIIVNRLLEAGNTETYKVRVHYKEDISSSQLPSTNDNYVFKFSVTYVQADENAIKKEKIIHPLEVSTVDTGDGLYEDGDGNYYYRGANPNNYLRFEFLKWRIIGIDDNGIKIMSLTPIIIKDDGDNNHSIPYDASNEVLYEVYRNTYVYDYYMSSDDIRFSYNSSDYCYGEDPDWYHGCNTWASKTTTLNSSGNPVTSIPAVYGSSTLYQLPNKVSYVNKFLNEEHLSIYENGWYYHNINSEEYVNTNSLWNIGRVSETNGQSLEIDRQQEQTYKWRGTAALLNVTDFVRASKNSSCSSVYQYANQSSCYSNSSSHNYLSNYNSLLFLNPANNRRYIWSYDGSLSSDSEPDTVALEIYPVIYLKRNVVLTGHGTNDENIYQVVYS